MIFQCLMSIYLGSWVFSFLLGGGEEFYGWQLCSFPPQWPPQCLLYHGKRLRVNFPTWGIRPQNGEENDQYVKPGLKCELEDPNYHSEELTILLRFGGFFPASLLQLAIWFFPLAVGPVPPYPHHLSLTTEGDLVFHTNPFSKHIEQNTNLLLWLNLIVNWMGIRITMETNFWVLTRKDRLH